MNMPVGRASAPQLSAAPKCCKYVVKLQNFFKVRNFMPPPHQNPNRFSSLRLQVTTSPTLQTGLNFNSLPHAHFLMPEVTNLSSELKYSFLAIFNNPYLVKVLM